MPKRYDDPTSHTHVPSQTLSQAQSDSEKGKPPHKIDNVDADQTDTSLLKGGMWSPPATPPEE